MDAVDAVRPRSPGPLCEVLGHGGGAADHLRHRLVVVSAGVCAPVPRGPAGGLPRTWAGRRRPAANLCRERRPPARSAAPWYQEPCPLGVARHIPRSLSPAASTGI